MHPRSLISPCFEALFQVTKRGLQKKKQWGGENAPKNVSNLESLELQHSYLILTNIRHRTMGLAVAAAQRRGG